MHPLKCIDRFLHSITPLFLLLPLHTVISLNSKITTSVTNLVSGNTHIQAIRSGNTITLNFWWATKAEVEGITLPNEMRPNATVYVFVFRLVGSTYTPSIMAINANGTLSVRNTNDSVATDYSTVFAAVTYVSKE